MNEFLAKSCTTTVCISQLRQLPEPNLYNLCSSLLYGSGIKIAKPWQKIKNKGVVNDRGSWTVKATKIPLSIDVSLLHVHSHVTHLHTHDTYRSPAGNCHHVRKE